MRGGEPEGHRRRSFRGLILQALKFGAVGVLNSAITFLSFAALHRLLGMGEYWANAASYALGLVNSFLWNKLWTFRMKGFRFREVLAFLGVFAASYAVQLLCFRLFRLLGARAELSELLAMAPYTAVNFIGNKFLTFKKGEKDA